MFHVKHFDIQSHYCNIDGTTTDAHPSPYHLQVIFIHLRSENVEFYLSVGQFFIKAIKNENTEGVKNNIDFLLKFTQNKAYTQKLRIKIIT